MMGAQHTPEVLELIEEATNTVENLRRLSSNLADHGLSKMSRAVETGADDLAAAISKATSHE